MQPYGELFGIFGAHRFWLTDILACVVVAYTTCVFGVAFGKMGRSPYLGLLFAIPFVGIGVLWAFGLGNGLSRRVESAQIAATAGKSPAFFASVISNILPKTLVSSMGRRGANRLQRCKTPVRYN